MTIQSTTNVTSECRVTRYSPPGLLTPPPEAEDIHPYRRVWPSIFVIFWGALLLALVTFVATNFLGINVPPTLDDEFNLFVAIVPLLLWSSASLYRERFVPQPRQRLLAVCLISGLVANAITVPLINETLQPQQWLSLAGALDRIIGYTVAVGLVQELSKYLVLRSVIWPGFLRTRYDMLDYSVAASIGYVTVIHLRMAFGEAPPLPAVFAVQVFFLTGLHMGATGLVAFGLSELHFNPRSLFLMPLIMLSAAGAVGIALAFRASFSNAGFVLGIALPNSLFGLVFSIIVGVGLLAIVGFVYSTAERRDNQSLTGNA